MNSPQSLISYALDDVSLTPTSPMIDTVDDHPIPTLSVGPIKIFKESPHNQNRSNQNESSTTVTNSGNQIHTYNTQLHFNIRCDQPAVATEYTKEQDIEIAASYEGPRLLASGTESPLSQQKKVQRPNPLRANDGASSSAYIAEVLNRPEDIKPTPGRPGQPSWPTPPKTIDGRKKSFSGNSRMSGSVNETPTTYSKAHIKEMRKKHIKVAKIDPRIRAYMSSEIGLGGVNAIPLWNPLPNMNLASNLRHKYCTLGDVGIFKHDGTFEVMFNILLSRAENEEMKYTLPPSFEPLKLHTKKTPFTEDITHFTTLNFDRCNEEEIRDCVYCFKSTRVPDDPAGAILVLPESGTAETFNEHNFGKEIDHYVAQHCDSWYELLNGSYVPSRYPNGALKMIHTCYKSKVWSAASILRDVDGASNCKAKLKHSTSTKGFYTWEAHKSFRTNRGSSTPEMKDYHCDYTVAVEVFTITRQKPTTGLLSTVFRQSNLSSRFSLGPAMSRTVTSLVSLYHR